MCCAAVAHDEQTNDKSSYFCCFIVIEKAMKCGNSESGRSWTVQVTRPERQFGDSTIMVLARTFFALFSDLIWEKAWI